MVKPTKDQMQRDMVKLSYSDINGRTAMVVQYKAGFAAEKLRDNHQSEEPIYVAFEGQQPEELNVVLEELRRYRTNTKHDYEALGYRLETLSGYLDSLLDRVADLERKRKLWRWGRK